VTDDVRLLGWITAEELEAWTLPLPSRETSRCWFDPESETAIADAIERVLSDRQLAERLILAGRQRAGQFSWRATAEGTLAAYRRAAEPRA
jgi:glycosyltransferase involved in cell wall biosynthesis